MKNKVKTLIAAVILILAFALTGCSAAPVANTDVQNAQTPVINTGDKLVDLSGKEILANKLTVSAAGTKKVMPDVAYVTVGVTTQNKAMKKAQEANKEAMNALYTALEGAGLAKEDIQTVNYNVYPIYDPNGTGKVTGYNVTNTIELTIKDIDTVGDFIDLATANGANSDYSFRFGLQDTSAYYNEALAEAVKKARSKADTIATAGGYKIINTLDISESQNYYAPQYGKNDMAVAEGAGATPITAGLIEITANVSVVYQIQ